MPYINIVWDGVSPPASPPWGMPWESPLSDYHVSTGKKVIRWKPPLKERLKNFKRISMNFCPDSKNKIMIWFGSFPPYHRHYGLKSAGHYTKRRCVFEHMHTFGRGILRGVNI